MSEYSYKKLAEEYRIEIPSLQRAYAQGRDTKRASEIRNNFIVDIKETLDNNAKLSLDTVYGELSDKVFIPLDGQQRLTTLFLLHLYLARYAEIAIAEVPFLTDQDAKSKFRYETRTTSGDFCDYLIQKDFRVGIVSNDNIIQSSFDENNQEKEGITQRIIKSDMNFQWTWYNDPTIAAMLNMLDTIHKIFCGDKAKNAPGEDYKGKCLDYYQKLVPTNKDDLGRVTFWHQEITKAIPADELYVRMNARGLALTEFENYKASLFYFLGNGNPTSRTIIENTDKIKNKIDSEWQTAVWNYFKDNNNNRSNVGIGTAKAVDTILLRILHMCILFELMRKYLQDENRAKRTSPEKLVKDFNDKKRFDQYELSQCEYYRDLDPDDKVKLSGEIVRMMDLTMDAINNKSVKGDDELQKLLAVDPKVKFSYEFVLDFYLRYYLVPKADGQTEVYNVLKRLIKYSYITEFKNFENALNALFELTPKANVFLQEFRDAADPEEFVHNGFAKNQTWEEYLKLKMKENKEWKQSIEAAENDPFFGGQILFLFECLLDDDIAESDASEKTDRLKKELVDRRDDHLELLENFNKYYKFCQYALSNTNSNCLRKLLMLRSIFENAGQKFLPVYPFTPEYANDWNENDASSLRNPGSMILDGNASDKLSWKRVLRIDLSNQKNDKAAYRRLIRITVKAACDEPSDTFADKMQSLLDKWKEDAKNKLNPPADEADEQQIKFYNVRKTLLDWCEQDWCDYRGIRLHDHGQLYLLRGGGARLDTNYSELHMMLLKARLPGYQFNFNARGRLTIPLERTQEELPQEEIRLEYYERKVRGCRCRQDRNSDLDWQYCEYEPEAVRGLIENLKKAGVTQTSPDGECNNTPA